MPQAKGKTTPRRKAKKVNRERARDAFYRAQDVAQRNGRANALALVDDVVSHAIKYDGHAPWGLSYRLAGLKRRSINPLGEHDHFLCAILDVIAATCNHSTTAALRERDAARERDNRIAAAEAEERDRKWRDHEKAQTARRALLVEISPQAELDAAVERVRKGVAA